MKRGSLRWKLVLWAAFFAFSASIICVWATWILLRAQEGEALDGRLPGLAEVRLYEIPDSCVTYRGPGGR